MAVTLQVEVVESTSGGKRLRWGNLESLEKYKAKCKPGTKLAVTFERWQSYRSGRQSRLLHALFQRLSRKWGMGLDHVKMQFKIDAGYYIPARKIMDGSLEMPHWSGDLIDLSELRGGAPEIAYVKSESSYTTAEETDLIERVMLSCDENEVPIDDIRHDLRRRAMRRLGGVNE